MAAPTVPTVSPLPGLTLCNDINSGFAQLNEQSYSGYVEIASNTTLTSVNQGQMILITSGATVTLPAVSSMPAGATLDFFSVNAGSVIVTTDDIYVNNTVVHTFTLGAGDGVRLTGDNGAGWLARGSIQFPYSATGKLYALLNSPALTGAPTAPTQTALDNSTKLATTAYVKKAGFQFSNYSGVSGATTLSAGNIGQVLGCFSTGGYTVTLPAATAGPIGSAIQIFSYSNNMTISAQGSDAIQHGDNTNSSSFVLNAGDNVVLFSDASGAWFMVGGTAQVSFAAAFKGPNFTTQSAGDNSAKLATTGYVDRGASGASRILLTSTNVTTGGGVAAVAFTGIPAGYDEYIITMDNVVPVTNGAQLRMQWSNNNGSSWLTTNNRWSAFGSTSSGANQSIGSGSDSSIFICGLGNTATLGVSGAVHLFGLGGTSNYKHSTHHVSNWNSSDYELIVGSASNTASGAIGSAINGVQFLMSTGNISTGKFNLYAVRNT